MFWNITPSYATTMYSPLSRVHKLTWGIQEPPLYLRSDLCSRFALIQDCERRRELSSVWTELTEFWVRRWSLVACFFQLTFCRQWCRKLFTLKDDEWMFSTVLGDLLLFSHLYCFCPQFIILHATAWLRNQSIPLECQPAVFLCKLQLKGPLG